MTDGRLPPSAEALERVRRPLEQAWTLPPAAYTDESVYALEVERIMRRSWLPVARVDQLAAPGDYLAFDLFGQPMMVVHGADGAIRAMSSVCLHRAAPVVAEAKGRRSLFTCPYHAWAYDTAGQLVRAPLMDGASGFAERDCRLPRFPVEIWEGFVMVNLDPGAAPFAPTVETYRRYFASYRLADMVVVRTLDYAHDWNWKCLVENFMEAYHHIAAHGQTLEPAFHAADSRIPDNDGPWSILHMPAAHPHAEGGLPLIEGLEPWQQNDLVAAAVFPHFLIAVQGSAVFWYQLFPRAAGRLDLKIHVCVPAATAARPDIDELAAATAELVALIHGEDIAVNDLVAQGLAAPATGQGRLSPLERSIWQLNQWWLDRMTGGAPAP